MGVLIRRRAGMCGVGSPPLGFVAPGSSSATDDRPGSPLGALDQREKLNRLGGTRLPLASRVGREVDRGGVLLGYEQLGGRFNCTFESISARKDSETHKTQLVGFV